MTTRAAFSLYDWVENAASLEQTSLRRLADPKSAASKGDRLTTSVRALLHWCSIIEQLTLDRHAAGARVIAGFERASRIKPVLKRYQQLSTAVDQLMIFGELDEPVALDAQFVDVTGCALAREWFLLVHAPNYTALLAARDLDGFGATGSLARRRFVGVTLTERSLVEAAMNRLVQHASKAE